MKQPKTSPQIKKLFAKQLPTYINETNKALEVFDNAEDGTPAHFGQRAPDQFMRHMDTSFESFFYQRDYTEKNFNFYLSVLAS
mmetsp:Transcript_33326/g.51076  ORF Transcript_33326/g.51076 Transcript_33326/m.51076 type:complete len:83 (+) Transcript_33326:97-345(+)